MNPSRDLCNRAIRIGTQVLCIERVDGGVTTDPALLAKLQGWEF